MAATAVSERCLKALATSIGALTAAMDLDVDRSENDREFFLAEKATLQAAFDKAFNADMAVTKHALLAKLPLQARTVVGDHVLDRGVRATKSGMRLALKNSGMPDGADHVFPSDISEITDAERRVEPQLVLKLIGKFEQVPDYNGKSDAKADLEGRAKRQAQTFFDRDAGEVTETELDGALSREIAAGDDALLRFEKRLEERFLRDAKYVASFFTEKPSKKKKPPPPEGTGG